MPMLALNGVTIPLAFVPLEADIPRFGDEADAHDGTALTRIRARKRVWTALETVDMPTTQAATVLAALTANPPIAATGDLTGSISVLVHVTGQRDTTEAGLVRRRGYIFEMREL